MTVTEHPFPSSLYRSLYKLTMLFEREKIIISGDKSGCELVVVKMLHVQVVFFLFEQPGGWVDI